MAIYDVNGNVIATGEGSFEGLKLSSVFAERLLIRHGGGNSHANFVSAYNNGYRAVEGDVRFTSDDIPIMSHDASMGGLSISGHTLAELQAVATVYTFDQWMLDCKKYNIFAEIDFSKTYTDSQCQILVSHIKAAGMTGRCTIESYLTSSAVSLTNYSTELSLTILGATSTTEIDKFSAIAEKSRQLVCSIPVENLAESLVQYAHNKNYIARVWTGTSSDTVSQVNGYLNAGVDWVITDTVKPSDITPA